MTKEEAIKILHPISDEYCQMANIRMTQAEDDICEALDMAIKALKAEPCKDAISRQAAIHAALEDVSGKRTHEFNAGATRAANRIKRLPSAQPEIIRCKDCKYNVSSHKCLHPESFFLVPDDDFYCGYAERKINERTG